MPLYTQSNKQSFPASIVTTCWPSPTELDVDVYFVDSVKGVTIGWTYQSKGTWNLLFCRLIRESQPQHNLL